MDELAFPTLTVSLNNHCLGKRVPAAPAPRTMSWGRKRLRVPVTSAALCGTFLARLLASISHPPVKMLSLTHSPYAETCLKEEGRGEQCMLCPV